MNRLTAAARTSLLAALVLTAACGESHHHEVAPVAGPPVSETGFGLTEWTITTSGQSLQPGTVTLRVTNVGATTHNMVATGELGRWRTPMLRAGEQTELTIQVAPGELLHLYCSVAGHHRNGMHALLPVAEVADELPG